MSNKKNPIDPICALCRIALLNFKDIHTKIGINGHAISLQEPSTVQSIMRLYNGDCKEDIFGLFYMIVHLITWFLIPLGNKCYKRDLEETGKLDERFLKDLKTMIRFMSTGLEKLQNTYRTGNVVLTIQYYINILEDGLKGSFDTKRLPQCLIEDLWIDSPLKIKISELWDYERLHRVCAIFEECSIESEKSNKIKNDLINGYLLSIENILATYEREFSENIKQWL